MVVVVLSSLGVVRLWGRPTRPDLIRHRVAYDRLQLTITERGTLESAENSDIVCRVKARSANSTVATTIRWVIDDGTQVKRGDRLVQLDDSGLVEELKKQKIVVDQKHAEWVQAEKAYDITVSQNKSDLAKAKLDHELAKLDLEKFEEGEYIQSLQDVEGRLMVARSDLAMWEERSAWSMRMSKPGRRYVTTAQAQADEARLKSAQIALSKLVEEKRVLENYTKKRTMRDLQGKVEEAVRALDREGVQSLAKEAQGDADRRAKRSIYDQELSRYYDIEDEIKKCLVLAPQDGLVVYYMPEQSRFGSGSQQSIIAQGEPVREGQKLMRIPNLDKMLVNTRIHEAMVSRVHGERIKKTGFGETVHAALLLHPDPLSRLMGQIGFEGVREDFLEANRHLNQVKFSDGLPAHVRVEAFSDRQLPGEVKTVATVASQQDWMSADVKVYQAMVSIGEALPGLKPGMTAEVTIYTDSQRENVLVIPIQSIVGSVDMGKKRRVYVYTPDGPQPREVVIGLSNDKMAEVEQGLVEGEEVIVNPRALLSEAEKAALGDTAPARGNGKMKDKGGPGAKDKAGAKDKGKKKT